MTTSFDSLQFGPHLDIAARSSAGAGPAARHENQDNFLLIDITGRAHYLNGQDYIQHPIPGWTHGHARVAVLDGMGGHGRGREAAEAVVGGLLAIPACATLAELNHHLDLLHATLQHTFAGDCPAGQRPGTTLTMLELRADAPALLYHVGDSRLYELAEGRTSPLTIDHVPATVYAMEGAMDEAEWWRQVHGEHRPQIAQAFILGNAFSNPSELSDPLFPLSPENLPPFLYHLPDRRAMELAADSLYILATDGFWSCDAPLAWVARWPALMESTASARSACDRLFEEMLERPPPGLHPDNITAVVIRPRRGEETALPGKE